MSQAVTVLGVLSVKSVVVKGQAKSVWKLSTGSGEMDCWDNPTGWNPANTWPVTVAGTVVNKPYNGRDQFTLKGPAILGATPPVAPPPPVAAPVATAPTAPPPANGQPSAVRTAFDRMADKDRIVARESILKSVAEMLDKLARPRDQKDEPRGWQVGDVIQLCRTLEDTYIYRPEETK